ncbi:MAG: diguanylate cyclase [Sulfurimonas sp.]
MKKTDKKFLFMSLLVVVAWLILEFVFYKIILHIEGENSIALLSQEVWFKFLAVSVMSGIVIVIVLLFIRNLARQTMHYETLMDNLENEMKVQAHRFELALEGSQLGYWHWNPKTQIHDVDERWLKMLGLVKSDIQNKDTDWSERIHPDDLSAIMPKIETAIENKKPYVVEFRMLHKEGHYVWIQGSGAVTKVDAQGKAVELSGTHQDISSRKQLEIEHKNNELYLETLYKKNPNIIIVTDGKKLTKANEAFLNFFSQYLNLEKFLHEHDCICDFFETSEFGDTIVKTDADWIEEVITSSEPLVKMTKMGRTHYFTLNAKKIYKDKVKNFMVTLSDITENYTMRHNFEKQSIIDELTGVYNRRHFNTLFVDELNRARRQQISFSFLIIDVDNFKLYNDNYGHLMGDAALINLSKAISQRLQRCNEFLFRLGGEEFGVIFSGYSEAESLKYAQNICKTVEALCIEHSHNEPYGYLTVSIGICNVNEGHYIDSKTIYHDADKALYDAKRLGRNRVEKS